MPSEIVSLSVSSSIQFSQLLDSGAVTFQKHVTYFYSSYVSKSLS